MGLTRFLSSSARLARIDGIYDSTIEAWKLPTVPIANLTLNRVGVPIDENHPAFAGTDARARFMRGFRWNDSDNEGSWSPQGLTGSADAHDDGELDGRSWLVASWHNHEDTQARLSFVDVSNPKVFRYRHALLVEPRANPLPSFVDVSIHAGGVAWIGKLLYVTDTGRGLRVFDTSRIKEVSTGNRALIGRQPGHPPTYHAHDYRYIIPQLARYQPVAGFMARWSFCAIDRSAAPMALVTGEYESQVAGLPCQVYWWPLREDGWLQQSGQDAPVPAFLSCNSTDMHLQGIHSVRLGSRMTTWLSSTGGNREALLRRVVDDPGGDHRFLWPIKPEGLTYMPASDELWSSSEKLGSRVVFSVRREMM